MGGIGGGSPGTVNSLIFIEPTPDLWNVNNPLELKFILIGDPSSSVDGLILVVDAVIYDTHISTEPRLEHVMEYAVEASGGGVIIGPPSFGPGGGTLSGAGSSFKLILGDDWEGTYEVRMAGSQEFSSMVGGSSIIPAAVHGVGTLRRKTPLVQGTPVQIKFGSWVKPMGFPPVDPYVDYFWAWWFGVGPREAWDYPRSKEAVQFAGKKMPPPFNQLSDVFQVDQRTDLDGKPRYKIPARYAGVDAFSPDGRVVKQATVTQAVLRCQGRRPPPTFQTGSLGGGGGGPIIGP